MSATASTGRRLRRLGFAALAALAGIGLPLALAWLGALAPFETAAYDARIRAFPAAASGGPRIVLAIVDQKSLDVLERESGRGWPWRRDTHAAMIEALAARGARVIGFDVLFTERSEDWPEDDQALAAATAAAGRVVHGFDARLEPPAERGARGPDEQALLARHALAAEGKPPAAEPVSELVLPFAELAAAAAGLGSLRFRPDPDGRARRAEVMVRDLPSGALLPSFALAVARLHDPAAGPLVAHHRLRFRGPPGSFPAVSAFAVLRDHVRALDGQPPLLPPDLFRGAVVLVGSNLSEDLKRTPYAEPMPGVEIHATLLANLLSGEEVRLVPGWVGLAAALLLGGIAALAVVLSGRPLLGSLLALLAGAAWSALAVELFARRGVMLPVVLPLAALAASLGAGALASWTLEGRERRFLRRAFERYLAPQVIEEIVRDPATLKLGGVRRELTVFFSDLQGFTTLSEGLDPEDLVKILNTYLTAMSRIILARRGTVDKYIGDAIMAFWGAPAPLAGHAREACAAALENLAALRGMQDELKALGAGEVNVRIGLNTGVVAVGNMGSEETFNYTVMGDAVNLASRLEGVNKEYGTSIMASEATRTAAGPDFVWRELDLLQVKGKHEAVRVFELVDFAGSAAAGTIERVRRHEQALARYRARDFLAAAQLWRELLGQTPRDGPAAVLLERALAYAAAPPPEGWKGEHVMTSK